MGAWLFYRLGCIIVTLPKIDPRAEVHAIISAIFASSLRLFLPDVLSFFFAPQNFGPVVGQHAGSRPRRHEATRGFGSRCCSCCPCCLGHCRSPSWVFSQAAGFPSSVRRAEVRLTPFQTFRDEFDVVRLFLLESNARNMKFYTTLYIYNIYSVNISQVNKDLFII